MKVRVLNERDVYALLPMKECIQVMAETLKTLGRGEGVNPLRSALRFPDGSGLLGLMPAYLGSPHSTGVKVVTVMPGNHGTPYDSHQGLVLLFEMAHGCPVALVDASSITAIRTAAASGVATDLLARQEVKKLALLGSGVQAGTHLEAMLAIRDFDEVSVWSRSAERAAEFAERQRARHGIEVKVAESAAAATAGADIVCTVTSASEPVLKGEWIAPGMHINAVGACLPGCRELDTAAVVRARLFVDRRESTLKEAGDFLIPQQEGEIDESHIVGEIGEILLGKVSGRQTEEEVTLFKSLGIGVEDLGAAHYVYKKAEREGRGVEVELGGPEA